MKHEIIKSRAPYWTSSYAWPPCRSYLHCPFICDFIFLFNYGGIHWTEALLWSARIKDCQNFETPPYRYQDQKYTKFREATRTSGNRFHLLPAQIIFSNRSHLLPNYFVQHPYITMYSRSQPASTHSTAHDATVGERGRKQKYFDLRTSPGSLWRLHTRFDLFCYRLVAQRE